jgi:hypothetical protein
MQGTSDVDQLDLPDRPCELGDHGLTRDQSVLTDNTVARQQSTRPAC